MAILSIIFLSLVLTSLCHSSCPEEGCRNITIYLGPRLGSKIIYFPNNTINKTQTNNNNEIMHKPKILKASHRPVPDDDSFRIDDDDSGLDNLEPTSKNRTQDVDVLYNNGTLDLSGNLITGTDVKSTLSLLSVEHQLGLRRLDLARNNISQLPTLVFPVSLEYNLQELSLDHNLLDHISTLTRFEISRLAHLKVLNLSYTSLRYLNPLNLPNLQVLDLSHNPMIYLSPTSFSGMTNLRVLDVSFNLLEELFDNTFTDLYNLRRLSLASNKIRFVQRNSFRPLTTLQVLNLKNNSLTQLVELPRASFVFLGENPWVCSCPLHQVYHGNWPEIVDRDDLMCIDEDDGGLRQVKWLHPEELRVGCPRSDWWIFLKRNALSIITCIVLIVFFIYTLYRLLSRTKHSERIKERIQQAVGRPYTLLDDTNKVSSTRNDLPSSKY